MADRLKHTYTLSIADSAAIGVDQALISDTDTATGLSLDWFSGRIKVVLTPGETGRNIFPTGIPSGITTGKLGWACEVEYDPNAAKADRYTIFNVDGSAVDSTFAYPIGAGSCTTALTLDNPDTTYAQTFYFCFWLES